LVIVADLSAQVVEVNGGKAPTPSQAVLIGQIVRLQLAKTGDLVRQSRAIADMLVQLGVSSLRPPLPPFPEPTPVTAKTLAEHLAARRATQTASDADNSPVGSGHAMSAPAVSILDAIGDPELFGRWFRTSETWQSWFAFLRALFGLPMCEADVATFRACTGRQASAEAGYREAWLVVGRRGGKSLVLATVAAFLACFIDWRPYLAPGERGTIMVIAADRRQARTIYRYIRAMLTVPLLAAFVQRENDERIDLSNGVSIEIAVASYRSVRGYTVIAALCDELAFWRTDEGSSNPDAEIISALRPAMATVPGAVLLCASSPYARRGALWDAFRRHYGKASPVLVWKAPTWVMNCTVPQEVIDEAMEADAPRALAEYGAEFRTDGGACDRAQERRDRGPDDL
jgi:hypothetical protein